MCSSLLSSMTLSDHADHASLLSRNCHRATIFIPIKFSLLTSATLPAHVQYSVATPSINQRRQILRATILIRLSSMTFKFHRANARPQSKCCHFPKNCRHSLTNLFRFNALSSHAEKDEKSVRFIMRHAHLTVNCRSLFAEFTLSLQHSNDLVTSSVFHLINIRV